MPRRFPPAPGRVRGRPLGGADHARPRRACEPLEPRRADPHPLRRPRGAARRATRVGGRARATRATLEWGGDPASRGARWRRHPVAGAAHTRGRGRPGQSALRRAARGDARRGGACSSGARDPAADDPGSPRSAPRPSRPSGAARARAGGRRRQGVLAGGGGSPRRRGRGARDDAARARSP